MPRVANCEYKDGGCDDPRCKITLCIQREEELGRQAADALADAQELQSWTKTVAHLLHDQRGHPTEAQISEFAQHENVQNFAKELFGILKRAWRQFHR